jgi:hypothetical protein
MINLQGVDARYNNGFHIGVDKLLRYLKLFSENIQSPITSDEAYEHDAAVRDRGDGRSLGIGSQYQGREVVLLEYLFWGPSFQAAVTVMPVVKTLKMFCLLLQRGIAREPLPPEELPIIRVVEVFDHPVAPGLADGNEYRSDTIVQADAQDDPQGAGIPVASPKAECVVDLEEHGNSHRFPAPHEACRHVMIFLRSLGLDVHPMAKEIDDVDGIEPSISLDIAGTHEIHLMHMVDSRCLREIGIFDAFRSIGCFF